MVCIFTFCFLKMMVYYHTIAVVIISYILKKKQQEKSFMKSRGGLTEQQNHLTGIAAWSNDIGQTVTDPCDVITGLRLIGSLCATSTVYEITMAGLNKQQPSIFILVFIS